MIKIDGHSGGKQDEHDEVTRLDEQQRDSENAVGQVLSEVIEQVQLRYEQVLLGVGQVLPRDSNKYYLDGASSIWEQLFRRCLGCCLGDKKCW